SRSIAESWTHQRRRNPSAWLRSPPLSGKTSKTGWQCHRMARRGWPFPSEKLTTPLSKDNTLCRYMRPRLKTVGLEWVDFQVMRRTHASLMRELGVDPKI